MIPELDVHRVLRWAGNRIPPEFREEVRIEVDVAPTSITIVECRPPWDTERGGLNWTRSPIARLRYTKVKRTWTLYWRDQNMKFHLYPPASPTASIEPLLAEIDRDPNGIFWG